MANKNEKDNTAWVAVFVVLVAVVVAAIVLF